MVDFTVEGIITVDSSRGMRALTRFQGKLKQTVNELKKTSREIDKLDGRNIRITVQVNKSEVAELKEELKTIKDETVKVKAKAETKDALTDVEKLEAEIRAISDDEVKTKVALAGGAKALAEAEKIHAELELLERPVDVKIKTDASALNFFSGLKARAQAAAGSISAPNFSVVSAIAAIIPALVPLASVGTGIVLGFAGSFTTAAAGIGAFAAFAIPTIKDVAKAIKLLNTNTKTLSPEKLKEYNKQLRDLKKNNPDIYAAAQAFQTLKKRYMEIVKSIRPDVIKDVNIALGIAVFLIGKIAPTARRVSKAVTGLFGNMRSGLKNSEWQAFFTYIHRHSAGFITIWGQAVGNFITGIANMIRAFNPLTRWFNKGLLGMSKDFRRWSFDLSHNQGWKDFVKYVKTSAPGVKKFVGNLVGIFIRLVKALAPLGSKIIDVANGLLDMYTNFQQSHPKLSKFLTQAAIGVAVVAPFASTITDLAGAVAGLLGPWGMLAAAVVILAGGISSLDRSTKQWSDLMDNLHGLMGDLKDDAKQVWENFKDLYKVFKDSGAIEQYQSALNDFVSIVRDFAPLLKPLATMFGIILVGAIIQFGYALHAAIAPIRAMADAVKPVVHTVVGFFQWMFNVLVGHSIIPDLVNSIHRWFLKLVGFVLSPVRAIKGAVVGAWKFLKGKSSAIWGGITGAIKSRLLAAKSFVSGGVAKIRGAVSGAWSAISGNTSKTWTTVSSYVKGKISDAKTALGKILGSMKGAAKTAWGDIVGSARSVLGGVKGAVTGAFSGAGSWLLSTGSSIISGLASGIRGAIGSKIGGAMSAVGGFIKSHLPGSPVKKGPLRVLNRGYAGGQITKMVADGIRKQIPYLKSKVNELANAAGVNTTSTTKLLASGSMKSINDTVAPTISSGRRGRGKRNYKIDVHIPVGGDLAEAGRQVVDAIAAWEQAGGAQFDS